VYSVDAVQYARDKGDHHGKLAGCKKGKSDQENDGQTDNRADESGGHMTMVGRHVA